MTAMNVGGRRKEPLVFEPELISGLNSMSIKKVACGDMFAACLTGKTGNLDTLERSSFKHRSSRYFCFTDKGILLTFGGGENGCLGHGDHSEVKEVIGSHDTHMTVT